MSDERRDDGSGAGEPGHELDAPDHHGDHGDHDHHDDNDHYHAYDDRDGDDEPPFGLGFSLPPIQLPPIFTPEFRWHVPSLVPPRYRPGLPGQLAGALVFDAVDAALALADPGSLSLLRTAVGTLLAVVVFGSGGVPYLWEVLAVVLAPAAAGAWGAAITAVPTFLLLVLARARLGGRDAA